MFTLPAELVQPPTDFEQGLSQSFARYRYSPGVQFLFPTNISALFGYGRYCEEPIPGATQTSAQRALKRGWILLSESVGARHSVPLLSMVCNHNLELEVEK